MILLSWFRRLIGGAEIPKEDAQFSHDIDKNMDALRELFVDTDDFRIREFQINSTKPTRACVIYLNTIADEKIIREEIMRTLMQKLPQSVQELRSLQISLLQHSVLSSSDMVQSTSVREAVRNMMIGSTLLFIEKSDQCLIIMTPWSNKRAISEPETESVSRGPHDGFTELISDNIGMVRRRIKDPSLKIVSYTLGAKTQTKVSMMYLKDLALPELVNDVSERLKEIHTDSILESGDIEEFLEDDALTPFPQVEVTERPDKSAAAMLEGRIIILVDGTPGTLVVPTTFFQLAQTPEDHYQRAIFSSFKRIYRLLGFILATSLSSFYLALVNYSTHLIPVKLVPVLMTKRAEVPFPPLLELIIMQVLIDMILEGNLRMPAKLGQTLGVAGAIVIGQAAITANLITPAVVIVVSVTTITAYLQPRLSNSYSIIWIRYFNMLIASMFGFFGIVVAWMFWVIHLCSLQSFRTAYFAPIAPFKWSDWKDAIIRVPKWAMTKQPSTPGTLQPNKIPKGEMKH